MSGSKFAVLHVDDDSDSENRGDRDLQQQAARSKKAVKTSQKKVELILHNVERQRPKNKKTKSKVIDPLTGYVIQEDMDFKKQEIPQAITRSSSDTTPPPHEVSCKAKEGSPKPNNGVVNSMSGKINERLAECMKQLELTKEELADSRSQADYYKNRYKKLFELFKDAEFAERAKLVADLDRSQTNVLDLTSQVAVLNVQLEQMRTRLRMYEGKK